MFLLELALRKATFIQFMYKAILITTPPRSSFYGSATERSIAL